MKTVKFISIIMILLSLGACNTMKGLGQDIQKAGDKIEDAAN